MAGYLFAYFNFSGVKPFPAPHLTDIRGSSQPLAIHPMPLPALSPCSLLLYELHCCSAVTAMVTSKRHGHLIYREKEKSAGVCVCVHIYVPGEGMGYPFPFSFHFYIQSISSELLRRGSNSQEQCLAVGQELCTPSRCPSWGGLAGSRGTMSCKGCSSAPCAQLMALQQPGVKIRRQHLKSLNHGKE